MKAAEDVLAAVASEFARVVPTIDARVEHERWKPGIGPFEEERQLAFLIETTKPTRVGDIETEIQYPEETKWCDLLVRGQGEEVPIEAKLIRFRRDNGDIEPTAFNRVYSPFPGSSPSMLSDAKALSESEFPHPSGLLGLYYESSDEEFDAMEVDAIAEKVCIDATYWFDIDVRVVEIAEFDGLRHPVFDGGAIITWLVRSNED